MQLNKVLLRQSVSGIEDVIKRPLDEDEAKSLINILRETPSVVYNRGQQSTVRYAIDRFFGGPMNDDLYRATLEYKPLKDIDPSAELYSPKDMYKEFMMTKVKDASEPIYTDYVYNQPPEPQTDTEGVLQVLEAIRDSLMPKNTADKSKTVLSDWLTFSSANVKRRKIVCDSRFRVPNKDNIFSYAWVVNTTDQVGRDGTLRVRDLDRCKLLMGGPTWLPVIDPSQLLMRVIRVSVTDLDSRSPAWDLINGGNNIKRNYQLTYNLDQMSGGRARFLPDDGYVFDVPLTAVTQINLRVLAPSGPYAFPIDFIVVTVIAQGMPTILQHFVNGVPTNHGLNSGDIVSFLDFQSDSASLDLSVNRFEGWEVTVINPTTFSVDFDTTGVTLVNNSPSIYIEKYRFSFEFIFYCLL